MTVESLFMTTLKNSSKSGLGRGVAHDQGDAYMEMGKLLLCELGPGSSMNCDEAVSEVKNALLDMLWELFIEFGKPRV